MTLKFTGEFFIPGETPQRIEDDHVERYRFACRYARGCRALDIACGVGYGTKLLLESGAVRADGVDIAESNIEYAAEHFGAKGITFHVGDITQFSAAEPYDLIVCFETIEHVEDYKKALANLRGLLAPGGKLLISSPNRLITSPKARTIHDKPGNKYHVREFTIPELASALASAGFHVGDGSVFGQRQQRYIPFRWLSKMHRKLFKLDERTSPVVTPVANLAPRYFVILASRPGGGP